MAVSSDWGDSLDVRPVNKQPIGGDLDAWHCMTLWWIDGHCAMRSVVPERRFQCRRSGCRL